MKSTRHLPTALFLLLAAAPAPSSDGPAPTLEEVVERAASALGGTQRWAAIESLRLTGSYATFSSPAPFVLQRKRPDLYRFEHLLGGLGLSVGHDGETVWWQNQTPFAEVPWPSLPPAAYRRGYEADAQFEPPFLDARRKHHRLDLRGRTRFESLDVFELRVTLENGLTETWYLDAESYLPAARVSRAGFKIFETESFTFFSDYREVAGGILIPHHVENEIDNLVSVMNVESVDVDLPVEDSAFALPWPATRWLRALAGSWDVDVETRLLPNLPWMPDRTASTLRLDFEERLLEEDLSYLSAGHPRSVKRLYAFDRFRETFRIVQIDSLTVHPNILEGSPDGDRLVLSNLTTGTEWRLRGATVHDRLTIHEVAESHFRIDLDRSLDGGETWWTAARFKYSRKLEE